MVTPVSSVYSYFLCRVAGLQSSFRQFGPLKIEWPGKDGKHPRYPSRGKELPGLNDYFEYFLVIPLLFILLISEVRNIYNLIILKPVRRPLLYSWIVNKVELVFLRLVNLSRRLRPLWEATGIPDDYKWLRWQWRWRTSWWRRMMTMIMTCHSLCFTNVECNSCTSFHCLKPTRPI